MSIAAAPVVDLAEPMSPLHILFDLRGRVPRKIFWLYGVAMPLGLSAYLHAVLTIAGIEGEVLEAVLGAVLWWSALAVSVKRWHDRDKSGWWVLVQLVPAVGWLWALVENGMLRGSFGANRFGDDMTGRL